MAGGEQHAKQTLVEETKRLSSDLRNGHKGDPEKIGELLILICKMMIPMYMCEFVTVAECKKKYKTGIFSTIKIGSVSIKAPITFIAILIPYAGMFFVLGKAEGWW